MNIVVIVIFSLILLFFLYLLLNAHNIFDIEEDNSKIIKNKEKEKIDETKEDLYKSCIYEKPLFTPYLVNHNISMTYKTLKEKYNNTLIYFNENKDNDYLYLEWNYLAKEDKYLLFKVTNETLLYAILDVLKNILTINDIPRYKIIIYYSSSYDENIIHSLLANKKISFYIKEPLVNYYIDDYTCFYDAKASYNYDIKVSGDNENIKDFYRALLEAEYSYYTDEAYEEMSEYYISKYSKVETIKNNDQFLSKYPIYKTLAKDDLTITDNIIKVKLFDDALFNASFHKIDLIASVYDCNISVSDASKVKDFYDVNTNIVKGFIDLLNFYKKDTVFVPKYNNPCNLNVDNFIVMPLINYKNDNDIRVVKDLLKDYLS